MSQNKKVEDFTLEDLVKEALNIPVGWHEEVYVERGEVVFSMPLTQNSWVGKSDSPSEQLDSYIGNLKPIRPDDFETLYRRSDGEIEMDTDEYFDYKQVKGEKFDKAVIVPTEDLAKIIAEELDDTEYNQLLDTIQNTTQPQEA